MRSFILPAAIAAIVAPAAALAVPSSQAPVFPGERAQEARFEQVAFRHNGRRHARRVWRGNDGRYRCERDDGTEGTIIGALAGGIVGHEVAGENDETEGTIIGAVGGGLIGRAIDRDDVDCR